MATGNKEGYCTTDTQAALKMRLRGNVDLSLLLRKRSGQGDNFFMNACIFQAGTHLAAD